MELASWEYGSPSPLARVPTELDLMPATRGYPDSIGWVRTSLPYQRWHAARALRHGLAPHPVPCMMFLLCVENRCDVTVHLTTGVPLATLGDSPQRAIGCAPRGRARRPHLVLPSAGPVLSDGSAVDPCTRHGGRLLGWALEWLTTPLAPSPLNVWGQGRHGLLDHLA